MLFDAEFQAEVQRQLAAKRSGATLAEQLGVEKQDGTSLRKRFTVANDDSNQTLMWRALMKDCAFYYDAPTLEDEVAMKKKLQFKYDSLLQPGWVPSLTSRRDLLTWGCKQYNQNVEQREDFTEDQLAECDNYQMLISEFGPKYDKLKAKLGHIKGLFD